MNREQVSVRPAGPVERVVKWAWRKPATAAAYALGFLSVIFALAGAAYDLAFAADGKRFVTAGDEIRVIDVDSGKTTERFAPGGAAHTMALALGSDGKSIASAGADGRLDLWELGEKGPQSSAGLSRPIPVQRVAFDNGGKRVWAVGTDLAVHGWEPPAKTAAVRVEGKLPDPGGPNTRPMGFFSPTVSPDGRQLAALATTPAGPPGQFIVEIRVWDLAGERPREVRVLTMPAGWFCSGLAFSRTGEQLAVAASTLDPFTRTSAPFVLIWESKALGQLAK